MLADHLSIKTTHTFISIMGGLSSRVPLYNLQALHGQKGSHNNGLTTTNNIDKHMAQ